jgi:uncharacterized protein HemY
VLFKARNYEAAADKLQQAVKQAAAAQLPTQDQSLRYYLLGMAQRHAKHYAAAALSLRQTVKLDPSDSEARLELAQVLLQLDLNLEAKREAELALHGGLSDVEDQQDARMVIKTAKIEELHERFAA